MLALDTGLVAIEIPPTASFTRLRQALQAHADRGDWGIDRGKRGAHTSSEVDSALDVEVTFAACFARSLNDSMISSS